MATGRQLPGTRATADGSIDGHVKFRRREINRFNGAIPVDIAIGENDRFLTLVATDGRNGFAFDWVLFGDPRLELLPVHDDKPSGRKTP